MDHVEALGQFRRNTAIPEHVLHRRQHGRARRAQLVTQHGQEMILGAIGALG